MHILIEGIDKCGKSTLAKELSKKLYFPVVNRLKPKENIFTECVDFLMNTSESMIIDRFHLSEEAYGPVKRNKSRFHISELRIIELICLSLNTINIYCKDDTEVIKQRIIDLKEESTTTDEVEDILKGFDLALDNSILDWHEYRIGDDINALADKINKSFKKNDIVKRYDVINRYKTIMHYVYSNGSDIEYIRLINNINE